MSSQTSWSSPRLWLKCNRLLKLGRPVGAVTLSLWQWWWNERWIWGARGALNLISTNYPDHGHHGRLPLSRKNAHGRAGNRTRDLMVSSKELWPPSHEAGRRNWKLDGKMWRCVSMCHMVWQPRNGKALRLSCSCLFDWTANYLFSNDFRKKVIFLR